MNDVLSLSQAATRLGVTRQRMWFMLRKQNRFPGAYRIGRQWVIPRQELNSHVIRMSAGTLMDEEKGGDNA